ncbi:AzlC family ABC transporter permease [Streptosporangium carneum]|uniref:Branched-chain amino acid ABC transporter permease n=1 Tax=Streptosporangium carneum TaxID=47481 RepID=A0A9W6MG39_9ACTN|nr:AzlC family ABC transporter permease [Streptosporangium carneum]GLK12745.1 branched-chain amino acid ABC transporter permease [Streptosporangium carneum]
MLPSNGWKGEALQGALSVIPVIVGAVPFGLLFGALAQERGLDLTNSMLMSLLVNAGSAQMVGLGMLTSGAAWPLTVLTVLLVNLRHVFYSAALAQYVRPMPLVWRLVIAYGMIDAVYALAAKRFSQPLEGEEDHRRWYVLSSSVIIYLAWNLSTLCGWFFGRSVSQLSDWGLDFAVYATFIALVVSSFTSRRAMFIGLIAGAGGLLLHHLPYQSGLFAATLFATGVAAYWETKENARHPSQSEPSSPTEPVTAQKTCP